jgi:pimeloyl-ACP methyl ester carboxylesterase
MRKGFAETGDIRLAYEDRGALDAAPVVLIMGLGAQMQVWPESFLDGLVAAGLRVIRFDNRDVGLSTKLDRAGCPSRLEILRAGRSRKIRAPYTLHDMAHDAVGLLNALELHNAHLIGASMGGMIAQIVAARYPSRVRSLVSVMSTLGNKGLPIARPRVLLHMARSRPPAERREDAIRYLVKLNTLIGSPAYPTDEDTLRVRAEALHQRSYYPPGASRHAMAIASSGDRRPLVRSIQAPTLVIHGADDPLIPARAVRRANKVIPNARVEIIAGMGHDFPELLMPRLTSLATHHIEGAQRRHYRRGNRRFEDWGKGLRLPASSTCPACA